MTAGAEHPSLDRLQNWFQAAITHPDGVRQAPGSAEADSLLTRSKSLPALDRLAVYAHAYFARSLDCLREEYPALKAALGDELFDAFAAEYLQRFPPRSYKLFDLGTRFPQFLRDTRPADEGSETEPSWPDFLIDLASLELAFNEVFDGPGIEWKPILDEAAIAAIPPDRLPEARLIPVPCLRVLSLKYPVHTYFTAVQRKEEASVPEPRETFLAITRQRFAVRHFELSAPAYALLSALLRGETLGAAISEVANSTDSDELVQRLGEWFRDWAAQGFFLGIIDDPAGATESRARID
jgi:Putative DNA-binding domain